MDIPTNPGSTTTPEIRVTAAPEMATLGAAADAIQNVRPKNDTDAPTESAEIAPMFNPLPPPIAPNIVHMWKESETDENRRHQRKMMIDLMSGGRHYMIHHIVDQQTVTHHVVNHPPPSHVEDVD